MQADGIALGVDARLPELKQLVELRLPVHEPGDLGDADDLPRTPTHPFRLDHDVTLDETASHVAHVRDGVERLFAKDGLDADRLLPDTPLRRRDDPRFEMNAWVPLTQFVHHGSDHRAQIGTILGANGLEAPDLQVWPYAVELGATREAKEA